MFRTVRLFAVVSLVLAAAQSSASAQACEDLLFDPVEKHIESSLAVIHAKVKETKVVQLSEVGIECRATSDPQSCRMVEVQLDIVEVFKGDPDDVDTIYTRFTPDGVISCELEPLPGEEYVLFLQTMDGLTGPRQPSFAVYSKRVPKDVLEALGSRKRLETLRRWKATQHQ